jgi:hypothetical protein
MSNVLTVGARLLEVGLRWFVVLSRESMSDFSKYLARLIIGGLVNHYLPKLCELLEKRFRRYRRKPHARKIRGRSG